MPLTFGVTFECIRHRDWPIAQILAVHRLDTRVGSVERSKVDESEAFRVASLRIPHYFWRLQDYTKCAECVIQQFFVHFWIKISYKYICSNVQILLMRTSLVHPNRFAIKFDHVHDFNSIICIFFSHKFNKSISLMHLGYSIFRHVYINNGS